MSVQSAKTALAVLEAVADKQPCGVSDLARHLGLHKATVHRFLVTLAEAGWIKSHDHGVTRWILTGRALAVGSKVGVSEGLRDVAFPIMQRLQADVGETINLGVPDDHDVVSIARVESQHPMRVSDPLGTRYPLHSSANAKCILAHRSDREIAEYVERALAEHGAAEVARLRAELSGIRRRGYGVNHHDGIVVVAACIRPSNEQPIGSISIFAPRTRLPRRLYQDYGHRLLAASNDITAALAAGWHRHGTDVRA